MADKTQNTEAQEEFEDRLEGFLGAEIEVEDAIPGSEHPVIQWVNGTPQGKAVGNDDIAHTGGFFMSADQGIEPPPGFKPHTLMTSEGNEVLGYACKDLTFSPIRTRRSWVVDPGDNKLNVRFAYNDYESAEAMGSPRGVAHVLIGIEGVDDPILLSFRGLTAKAMMGQQPRGVVPEYSMQILRAAKRVARTEVKRAKGKKARKYPMCAFRLTVGPERDDKGKPVHTKVGQGSQTSQITLPVWLDKPRKIVEKADLARIYVGHETFGIYQDMHMETEEWRAAWDAQNLQRTPEKAAGLPAAATDGAAEGQGGLPGDQNIPF